MSEVVDQRYEHTMTGATYRVSRSALVNLIDSIAYSDPDGPEPTGPGGPVIRFRDFLTLHRQFWAPRTLGSPLTQSGPHPEPWGPHPEPLIWTMVTRATITETIDRYEMAVMMGAVNDVTEQAAASAFTQFVDDFCGTPTGKKPFPGPFDPVLDPETIHPANLMVAGVQFQKAADALDGHLLHRSLQLAADRLISTAWSRI